MFQRIMEWLEADAETREDGFGDDAIRVSVAALFYHMVAVDGVVSPEEAQQLRGVLSRRYQLNDAQLDILTQHGKSTDQSSPGLFPFTVILNRELSENERMHVFDQLESLARADGIFHPLEDEMLAQMREMLKLPS